MSPDAAHDFHGFPLDAEAPGSRSWLRIRRQHAPDLAVPARVTGRIDADALVVEVRPSGQCLVIRAAEVFARPSPLCLLADEWPQQTAWLERAEHCLHHTHPREQARRRRMAHQSDQLDLLAHLATAA